MENEKIVLDSKSIDEIINNYAIQKVKSADIKVEFSGVNTIDTLFLLQIMNKKEPDLRELAEACEILLNERTVSFYKGDECIASYGYARGQGNKLHLMFSDKPYLYDMLQQAVYALLLKKLTPRLESSN